MRRTVLITVLACTLLLVYFPLPVTHASGTVLRFDPSDVVLGPDYCIGETFTLAARIDDVEELTGFDILTGWNTTVLEYVDHNVKVPVEVYPDGILHEPILVVRDDVNTTLGLYQLAVTILYPASFFYGSGIAFEITFRVMYQPVEPEPNATSSISFIGHSLADPYAGGGILHTVENCSITMLPYWNVADINYDLVVDIYDIVLGVNAYGSTPGDPYWNPDCDIAEPYDSIDIFDIVVIVNHYGEEYTP